MAVGFWVSVGLDAYASLGFDWLCFGVWQICGWWLVFLLCVVVV